MPSLRWSAIWWNISLLASERGMLWTQTSWCEFDVRYENMPPFLPLFEVKDCSGVYSLHIEHYTFNSYESALATFEKVIELKVPTSYKKVGAYVGLTHAKRIRWQTRLRSTTFFPWCAYSMGSQLRRAQKTLGAWERVALTKRGAVLVPTKLYMTHNIKVNAKESVHYGWRK